MGSDAPDQLFNCVLMNYHNKLYRISECDKEKYFLRGIMYGSKTLFLTFNNYVNISFWYVMLLFIIS